MPWGKWSERVSARVAAKSAVLVLALGLIVGGCAETRLLIHAAKKAGKEERATDRQDAPGTSSKGGYKVGKPYQVQGVWYYPRVDPNYDRTGIASWYGKPFHGRDTANGEVYDMNALTAAHKTLPLPSRVRVTNLENGRSIVLRVNDRGPFVHGRIIDVSRRAAQLLGFQGKGTAKVQVTAVGARPGENFAAKVATGQEERYALPAVPRGQVQAQALPPPPGAKAAKSAARAGKKNKPPPTRVASASPREPKPAPAGPVSYRDVKPGVMFVQAGTFARYDNANRLRARLARLSRTRVTRVYIQGQELFRVRVGPIAKLEKADLILQYVIDIGLKDARIIVD